MSKEIREKILEKYPARVYKNRKEHFITKDCGTDNEIVANTRTIPGIMTNRGCCYAGCKGVVLGPLKDVAIITHGPIGCGYYSWGTRRNKARAEDDKDTFGQYCLSTDMQESDIVFGGDKKLRQAIAEAVEIFDPACIMICSTCPVGLIGDDIHAVAAEAEAKYGRKVIAFSCEGYKGVSQSGGHHIANNSLFQNVIGTGDKQQPKYSINILGEYNIGGDGWEIGRFLKRIGYHVISVMTGDGAYRDMQNAHMADLNLVQCHRSINYIGEMMQEKYGTPWLKVNFIGLESTVQSLRDIAKYFAAYYDDDSIITRTEEVIADELADIEEDIAHYREILTGKTAALYVGGSRAHHYQYLLEDLGVKIVMAGYEFAHRDDYEGREVIPNIKEDADSKNITSIEVEPDEKRYRVFLSPEKYEKLKKEISLDYYAGMIKHMDDGTFIIDDLNQFETDEVIKYLKPDVLFSGIKDKFSIQKTGTLSRQLHSYDYSGPYAGFKGAVNFARDVAMGLTTPTWKYTVPPWKTESMLAGTVGGND